MTLTRSLSARALVIVASAAVFGFLCSAAAVRVTGWRNQTRIGELLRASVTDKDVSGCQSAPASWSLKLPFGFKAFAYDLQTLASHNHAAPPLRVTSSNLPHTPGDARYFRIGWRRTDVPFFVLRTRRDGACALVAAAWPAELQHWNALTIATGSLAVATAAATILGLLALVRPLARRVEALRRAAEAVGDEHYPPSEAPESLDELAQIRAGLDRAHARIVDSNERLARRMQALQEHLADVAHDLRTPLASLQALVEEALDSDVLADAQQRLRSALTDCVYLAGLTENLRLASQLEEGWDPARAGDADLAATVSRVVNRLAHYARRRGVSLQHAVPDRPVPIRCDPFACEQVISNLIENPITHLPDGGRVGVVLDGEPGGAHVLTIVDDGAGVPVPELVRLGERTFRSDAARARDPRGSGLGLAIARTISDRCGWDLTFSQAREGGLQVELRVCASS